MRTYGIFGLACLIMLIPSIIIGCQPHNSSDEVFIDTRTGIYMGNVEADCLAFCERSGAYGILTRNGCIYACLEITRTFNLQGRVYRDWQRCEEAVRNIAGNRFLVDYDEMCMTHTDNIHRQRGCLDGVRFYQSLLSPAAICQPFSPMYGPGVQDNFLSQ
jgi:hypothetical protein